MVYATINSADAGLGAPSARLWAGGSLIEPGLTTVGLHPYRIGQQAARLFLDYVKLQKRFEPRTCVVKSD